MYREQLFSHNHNSMHLGNGRGVLTTDTMADGKNDIKLIQTSEFGLEEIVCQLAILHSKLNDIVEIINYVYSPQVNYIFHI